MLTGFASKNQDWWERRDASARQAREDRKARRRFYVFVALFFVAFTGLCVAGAYKDRWGTVIAAFFTAGGAIGALRISCGKPHLFT